jgi:hypothetical protein
MVLLALSVIHRMREGRKFSLCERAQILMRSIDGKVERERCVRVRADDARKLRGPHDVVLEFELVVRLVCMRGTCCICTGLIFIIF